LFALIGTKLKQLFKPTSNQFISAATIL